MSKEALSQEQPEPNFSGARQRRGPLKRTLGPGLERISGKRGKPQNEASSSTSNTQERGRGSLISAFIQKAAEGMAQEVWPSFRDIEPEPQDIERARQILERVHARKGIV